MDKFVLGIFVDEIIHQCEFALMNWFDFKVDLKKGEDPKHLFGHIQAFLVAAANLSKLLWPKKNKFRSRGRELRSILGVPMNSPIKDKSFRNVFEHYDERIEKWAKSSTKKNYKDMNITIGGFSASPDVEVVDTMRNLDVSRNGQKVTLRFHGDSYSLSDAERAIEELVEAAGKARPTLW